MRFPSTWSTHSQYNSAVCCSPAQQLLCLGFSQYEVVRRCATGLAKNYLLSVAGKSLCEVNRRRMEVSSARHSGYPNKAGEELLNRNNRQREGKRSM